MKPICGGWQTPSRITSRTKESDGLAVPHNLPPRLTSRGFSSLEKIMPKFTDLSGRVFGRWTVLRYHRHGDPKPIPPSRKKISKQGLRAVYWWCRCECGIEKEVEGHKLKLGRSKQCHACKARGDHEAGRLANHTARLSQPVWDRRCKWCGSDFIGTARQQYCERHRTAKSRQIVTHPCG